ncbi:hypothetical protein SETIT_5G016700v2 [Setaria italica]|uniref:GDSL esterase/lipase n=1 Tax=Setaria italica TaxID=4555 RepID=A0A368R040_SETIT|nr:hypothetical protein SETIT_5G016700v2 [Setaria italica]
MWQVLFASGSDGVFSVRPQNLRKWMAAETSSIPSAWLVWCPIPSLHLPPVTARRKSRARETWASSRRRVPSRSSSSYSRRRGPGAVTTATATAPHVRVRRRYDSIFSLGDSYADTGNGPVVLDRHAIDNPVMRPPYGSNFFGRPTGRYCDGRLAIDFIAESLGLPLVPPFLARNGSFRAGANFAVAGATALDSSFFRDGELHASGTAAHSAFNTSLNVQLQWFESLKPSLCATGQECREFFGRSLFFVGKFGFNDYTILLLYKGKSVPQVRSFVQDVVRTISMAIERLIKHGATNLD